MNRFRQLIDALGDMGGLRYYVFAVLIFFSAFVWSELSGNRFLGDDSESKELHSGLHGANRFYHK